MLKLIDLIKLSGHCPRNFKIHCAVAKGEFPPLEAFFDGKFKEWQEEQTKRNFQCDEVLSLIQLQKDKWLFAGVFEVNGEPKLITLKNGRTTYIYSTTEVEGLEHLTGRAVVEFEKKFRASYLIGKKFQDRLIVSALREQRMTIGDFPGYSSVLLSYRMLKTVVRESLPSWESALSNVAGIYIVTDKKTGKKYVGSAYGGGGFWQRWVDYANSGHGGNKELRDLLKQKGNAYAENFRFAILEVCDLNANDKYVISRETHWKRVLQTIEFGYNKN